MRFAIATGLSWFLSMGAGACSSSSPSSATSANDGGQADGTTDPVPVATDAGHGPDAKVADAGEVPSGPTDAGAALSSVSVEASAACMDFCSCMATNCPTSEFEGGCLPDCAAQTTWDLPCRENMCGLVPAQPDNGHCVHAMGMIQCLDLDQ